MNKPPPQFFTKVMGEVQGPFTGSQIKKLAETGRLLPDSHVRKGADGNWTTADGIKGLSFGTGSTTNKSNRLAKPEPVSTSKADKKRLPLIMILGVCSVLAIGLLFAVVSSFSNKNPVTVADSLSSTPDTLPEKERALEPREEVLTDAETKPFAFVTNRKKMIGFAFARLQNADYLNDKGVPVSYDEMGLFTMGGSRHLKQQTPSGQIQARLSRSPDGQNFIYLDAKGNPTTLGLALDAASEFESVYTWVDATGPAAEAFKKLETAREDPESSGFNEGRSKTYKTQVGDGTASWYVQINEQFKADSYGPPWTRVLLQWDWKRQDPPTITKRSEPPRKQQLAVAPRDDKSKPKELPIDPAKLEEGPEASAYIFAWYDLKKDNSLVTKSVTSPYLNQIEKLSEAYGLTGAEIGNAVLSSAQVMDESKVSYQFSEILDAMLKLNVMDNAKLSELLAAYAVFRSEKKPHDETVRQLHLLVTAIRDRKLELQDSLK